MSILSTARCFWLCAFHWSGFCRREGNLDQQQLNVIMRIYLAMHWKFNSSRNVQIKKFNQRFWIPYHLNTDASVSTTAVAAAISASPLALIQYAENIFNYEIDKVIMNAKHLIDFSNLLKVTGACWRVRSTLFFTGQKRIKLNMCARSVFGTRVFLKLHYQKLKLSSYISERRLWLVGRVKWNSLSRHCWSLTHFHHSVSSSLFLTHFPFLLLLPLIYYYYFVILFSN